MIDGDQQHVTARSHIYTIEHAQFVSRSYRESATVNPEHDGALLPVKSGRPDVQPETIFAVAAEIPLKQKPFLIVVPDISWRIGGLWPESSAASRARPGFWWAGALKSSIAGRICAIWNSLEYENTAINVSTNLAARSFSGCLVNACHNPIAFRSGQTWVPSRFRNSQ
jgi:hypothetical protein